MTADEIMRLADEYRAAWGDGDEDMPRAALCAALEAQAARIAELEKDNAELREHIERRARGVDPLANHLRERIAELEGLLQQSEVNLVDAYDMCMKEIDRANPAEHLSKRIDCTTAAIRAALHPEVKP